GPIMHGNGELRAETRQDLLYVARWKPALRLWQAAHHPHLVPHPLTAVFAPDVHPAGLRRLPAPPTTLDLETRAVPVYWRTSGDTGRCCTCCRRRMRFLGICALRGSEDSVVFRTRSEPSGQLERVIIDAFAPVE